MIVNKNVPSGGVVLLSSSTSTSYAVTTLFLCNTSTTDVEIVSVYAVDGINGITDDALILKDLTIEPTETFVFNMEKLILENGNYIYAVSDKGKVSGVASYMEL